MPTRNTVQRGIIEAELRHLANHPTADEVYTAVHEGHPSISKATVYRTLNMLSEEGAISRVKINNGADHFDHTAFFHYHVRCLGCGKVDDVMIPTLAGIEETASAASGYHVVSHTLQFDGYCPACQAKGLDKVEVEPAS